MDKTSNGSAGFQCPKEFGGVTWAPEDIGDFKIISDGSLRGSNLPDYKASKDGSERKKKYLDPGYLLHDNRLSTRLR